VEKGGLIERRGRNIFQKKLILNKTRRAFFWKGEESISI
jgi:hypothetical protein